MNDLSQFSIQKDIERIHKMCDDAGVPDNISFADRVEYYMRLAAHWRQFLEFLGYRVGYTLPYEEEKELAWPDPGDIGSNSGGPDRVNDWIGAS